MLIHCTQQNSFKLLRDDRIIIFKHLFSRRSFTLSGQFLRPYGHKICVTLSFASSSVLLLLLLRRGVRARPAVQSWWWLRCLVVDFPMPLLPVSSSGVTSICPPIWRLEMLVCITNTHTIISRDADEPVSASEIWSLHFFFCNNDAIHDCTHSEVKKAT